MLWTTENKTPGPPRVAERRTGISSLGIPDWGPWVGAMVPPRSRGQPGGRLPRFPLAPTSRVTPSFTRKSSLPKIPHAAGKCKKGQNDVGVRVINHLVHKNCLITGKMWKSTYYSERRTLRACAGVGGRVSGCWELLASSSCRKCQNSSYRHPHHVITYKATSVPIEGNITHMRIFCFHFILK